MLAVSELLCLAIWCEVYIIFQCVENEVTSCVIDATGSCSPMHGGGIVQGGEAGGVVGNEALQDKHRLLQLGVCASRHQHRTKYKSKSHIEFEQI